MLKNIKISANTLIIINLIYPFILMISRNIYFDYFLLILSSIIMILFGSYKRLIKFLVVYFLMRFINYYAIEYIRGNNYIYMFSIFIGIIQKFIPILMISSVIVNNIKTGELLSSLSQARLSKPIILALTVAIRFIPTFKKEYTIIKESMRMRGIKTSYKKPLKAMEYFLVPVLFRCASISEELTSTAMLKGIEYPKNRTSIYYRSLSVVDYVLILVVIITLVICFLNSRGIIV